jgi:hypothetical protein
MRKFFTGWILDNSNKPILILFSVLIIIMLQLINIFTFKIIGYKYESNLTIESLNNITDYLVLISKFVMAVLLAPLFETLIFQNFLYFLLKIKAKQSSSVYITISAILFGCLHAKSHWSIIPLSIIVGLIFNSIYVTVREYVNEKKAFWIIVYIHLFVNLFSFILKYLVFMINNS